MVGAIRTNDYARLTKIPGVGKKTAERMCVELRDKLEGFGETPTPKSVSPVEDDVISALTNLGYQRHWPKRPSSAPSLPSAGKTSTRCSERRWADCRSDLAC